MVLSQTHESAVKLDAKTRLLGVNPNGNATGRGPRRCEILVPEALAWLNKTPPDGVFRVIHDYLVRAPARRVTSTPRHNSKARRQCPAGTGRTSMKLHFKTFGLVAGLVIGLANAAPAAEYQDDDRPAGRLWVPLGGQLKDMWEKTIANACRCRPCPAPASPMCAASRKARPISASAIRSRPSTRIAGNPPFNKPHDNVCNIATFYPQYYPGRGARRCRHQHRRRI